MNSKIVSNKLSDKFKMLRDAGFIHVTGLQAIYFDQPDLTKKRLINVSRVDWGKWETNNGMMSVVLPEGHVWISRLTGNENRYELESLAERLCPNGTGCFVPCSNGEAPHAHHIMARVADPMWYGYSTSEDWSPDPNQVEIRSRHLAESI